MSVIKHVKLFASFIPSEALCKQILAFVKWKKGGRTNRLFYFQKPGTIIKLYAPEKLQAGTHCTVSIVEKTISKIQGTKTKIVIVPNSFKFDEGRLFPQAEIAKEIYKSIGACHESRERINNTLS